MAGKALHAAYALILTLALASACSTVPAPPAAGGEDLTIEWSTTRLRDGRALISGCVNNNRSERRASNVILLVEGLGLLDPLVVLVTVHVPGDSVDTRTSKSWCDPQNLGTGFASAATILDGRGRHVAALRGGGGSGPARSRSVVG